MFPRCGFSFSPPICGEIGSNLTKCNILQMGWFDHQLVSCLSTNSSYFFLNESSHNPFFNALFCFQVWITPKEPEEKIQKDHVNNQKHTEGCGLELLKSSMVVWFSGGDLFIQNPSSCFVGLQQKDIHTSIVNNLLPPFLLQFFVNLGEPTETSVLGRNALACLLSQAAVPCATSAGNALPTRWSQNCTIAAMWTRRTSGLRRGLFAHWTKGVPWRYPVPWTPMAENIYLLYSWHVAILANLLRFWTKSFKHLEKKASQNLHTQLVFFKQTPNLAPLCHERFFFFIFPTAPPPTTKMTNILSIELLGFLRQFFYTPLKTNECPT